MAEVHIDQNPPAHADPIENPHYGSGGQDPQLLLIQVMTETYKLVSLQVKDYLDDVKARNEEIKTLREFKADVRAWQNGLQDSAREDDETFAQQHIHWRDGKKTPNEIFKEQKYDSLGYRGTRISFRDLKEFGFNPNETKTNYEDITTIIDNVNDKIDDLANINQLKLIKLQQGLNNLNLLTTLMTNTIKSTHDSKSEVARGI